VIVSQDELGSRQDCEAAVFRSLSAQQRVVVDRTNIDQVQRSHWLGIARKLRMPENSIACLSFNVPLAVCKERVMSRKGHRTLPAERSSLDVVHRFFSTRVAPSKNEGFGAVVNVRDSNDPQIQKLMGGFLP
jgi:predicted kinase